jgi:hypothetical protein
MSDTPNFDFSKFVPGFDFLQNLAKGATQKMPHMPQMPKLGSWVAPTINVEELEKRIDELKAVQFWLDQNAVALKATIQALEVQKMTLATLQGMNFSMGDLADAFKIKTPSSAASTAEAAPEAGKSFSSAASSGPASSGDDQASGGESDTESDTTGGEGANGKAPGSVVDPLQWWNSLTTQFQQIAASALKDTAGKTGEDGGMAASFAKDAFKSAEEFTKAVTQPLSAPFTAPFASPGSAAMSSSADSGAPGKRPSAAAKKAPAGKAAGKTTTAAAKKRTR